MAQAAHGMREDAPLLAAIELLTDAQSTEDVVARLRAAARAAVGADGICVVLRDGDYVEYVAEDAMAPLFKGQRFKLEFCISGLSIRDRATIVIPDILADPRAPRAAYEPTFVRSMAMAPIGEPDPIASIGAYWAKIGMPDAHAVTRLEAIARSASTALKNMHLMNSLRLSEARLRGVLDSISNGFYAVDRNWRISEFNAAAEAYFGLSRDKVIGRDYWELAGDVSDAFKDLLRAAMNGAPMAMLESQSLYRPGRYVELRVAPTVEGIGIALTDVTDRWLARQRLEEAVAERTAELRASEQKLRQAQKLEAVGQLTGGVAHDFNNLLMVISGGLNMLERSDTPERRQMLTARMREAVERGATLTKQLLAFSRRHELTPTLIELKDYFADLNDLLSRSLGVDVRVAIDVADGVAPVFVDPNALQLAVLNLAVNARDAMNDTGVVTISVRNGAPGDPVAPVVSIAVSDTGVGMSAEVLEHLFEPFFTTKDIGQGSGLGLAQVHGFAEQSGGRVEVESKLGVGTTMTLVLPRGEGVATRPRQTPERTPLTPASARGAALLWKTTSTLQRSPTKCWSIWAGA
jgi:PAS domain S-box-containing protein